MTVKHAFLESMAGGEFTFCGIAFDAFDSGDVDEPIVQALPSQIVTCESCRMVISEAKAFKGYRVPAATPAPNQGEPTP